MEKPGAGVIWAETHTGVPVAHGVHNVYLGSQTPLDTLAFDDRMQLRTGVNGQLINPARPFASVPCALGVRGLRVIPADNPEYYAPNLIGGHSSNVIEPGVAGGTIGGGGLRSYRNELSSSYGVIAGGNGNRVSGDGAMIGGGLHNRVDGHVAAVLGGNANYATAPWATVGGGFQNRAEGNYAMVLGGRDNKASGDFSFA